MATGAVQTELGNNETNTTDSDTTQYMNDGKEKSTHLISKQDDIDARDLGKLNNQEKVHGSLENGQRESSIHNGVNKLLEKEPFSTQKLDKGSSNVSIEDVEGENSRYIELADSTEQQTLNTRCENGHDKDDNAVMKKDTNEMQIIPENEKSKLDEETPSKIETERAQKFLITPPKHSGSPAGAEKEKVAQSGGSHKSEVTGGAETSESEDDDEDSTSEQACHGSHISPDAKNEVECRENKNDVTGKARTSESKDETAEIPKEADDAKDDAASQMSDNWMDILGNGLLKRRILRPGKGRDTRPERGQIVMMSTAGRLEDGTPVDWNQCLEFILGDGEVIQAWDVAVALFELNEVCELVTDARYAYGQQGSGEKKIPPNAKITYEIELLAVRDGPDMDTMDNEERIKIGDKKRKLGNDLYARGDFSGAINCYQRAIKYLTPSTGETVQDLKVKCWNNLAAAQLKVKAHSVALASCMQVLNIDPDNLKALFRKGKVLAAQGDLEEALVYLKKASNIKPGNKTILTELANVKRRLTVQNQKERNMYERMVGGLAGKESTKPKNSFFPWSLVFGATVVVLGGIVAAMYLSKH